MDTYIHIDGMDDHEHMYSHHYRWYVQNGGPEIGPNGGLKGCIWTHLQKGASEGTHGDTHLRVIHVYMV